MRETIVFLENEGLLLQVWGGILSASPIINLEILAGEDHLTGVEKFAVGMEKISKAAPALTPFLDQVARIMIKSLPIPKIRPE